MGFLHGKINRQAPGEAILLSVNRSVLLLYYFCMIEAVIFDMDGLMVNTEPIRSLAFEEMIEGRGRRPRRNWLGVVQTIGINVRDNCSRMQEEYGLGGNLDELVADHEANYTRLVAEGCVVPMPGLLRLVTDLGDNGVKRAIASSSSHEHIDTVVGRLWRISPFDVVASGTEVERGKPAPDIFLLAAERLGVAASNCVVLEDAESGIRGAKEANMSAIAVPNPYTRDHDFSRADLIVPSLEHVNVRLLSGLIAMRSG
jgi:HAD superfamily hydrolase (TIGR01509 family)